MGLFGGGGFLSKMGNVALSGVPGIGQYFGAQDTNAANVQMAREQMQFQERMSNTAYQRQTADMEAAGINPLIAMSEGGASTPSGALARLENPAEGVAEAAAGSVKQFADLMKTVADTKYTNAQTTKLESEQPQRTIKGRLWDAGNKAMDFGEKAFKQTWKSASDTMQKIQERKQQVTAEKQEMGIQESPSMLQSKL